MELQIEKNRGAPRIAIITPVFRHSVLVTEAIESFLAQRAGFAIHLVLVNDGCPHSETDEVCLEYACAYPNQITYLRKKNGGLSSARNHGIRYALNRWEELEAVYLLDADNRLRTGAMHKGMRVLDSDPACDWVYPSIDMFGIRWAGDYGGKFSLLNQALMNTCEAGSLIRRRVFEAGVIFDTDMRLGFEDWDFFLTAAEHGFRGKNLDDLGFLYRKRPESMLADSTRDQDEILAHMTRKHRRFMSPRNLVKLEQQEAPRYAVFFADTNRYLLTVDPDQAGLELSPSEFARMVWGSWTARGRIHAPGYLVVTSTAAVQTLREAKLLHWTLWRLEEAVETRHVATVTHAEANDDRYQIVEQFEPQNGEHLSALLVMLSPKCFGEVLHDQHSTWIDTLAQPKCDPRTFNLALRFATPENHSHTSAPSATVHSLLAQLHHLRGSKYRAAADRTWEWRTQAIEVRNRAYGAARQQFDGEIAFPRVPKAGPLNIGFLLPLVDFGGVEKVALNIARSLRNLGWIPHLIVLEQSSCVFSPELREVFETVSFLCDKDQNGWDGEASYFGTDIPPWARKGNHARAAGLLYWLDVAVNCHGGALHGLMGQLKRLGVTTVASLHLNDQTQWSRPVGHPYLGLAYEHAYDLVMTCSEQLANWCHGMGIPEFKILAVPNAASYRMEQVEIDRILKRRESRSPREPLRVLFLGRLDRQKGMHRLEAVLNNADERQLPVEFRIVGKAVVGDEVLPPSIRELLEPAAMTPSALSSLYGWADVLLLLSDFEGLPLTLLEAMRLGVTCISTNVGAVSEVLSHGETGFLIKPASAVGGCTEVLEYLASHRSTCQAVGKAAAQMHRTRHWNTAVEPLDAELRRMRSISLPSLSLLRADQELPCPIAQT